MSDRAAAHLPSAIRNLPARTRVFAIGAAAAVTIGAAVAIPALLAPAARPGIAVLAGHSGPVFSVAFSPDGKILASAGDTSMRLWDMATSRQIGQRLAGHTGGVISVAFSPDGQTLAGGAGAQGVRLWDVGTGHQISDHLTGSAGGVSSVAISPDGKTLAAGGGAHGVRLWDLATGRQMGDLPTGHTGWVGAVAFSPDGKTVAAGGGYDGLRSQVWLWDPATGRAIGHRLTRRDGGIGSVAFSPDGKTLATGSGDGTVRLWDVTTGHPVRNLVTGHTNGVYSVVLPVAFSPDGKTLASGSGDGTVRLWDLATHRQIGKPLTGHTRSVTAVAFSPDGKTLASASVDGTVRLWDVDTRRKISGATTATGPPANGATACHPIAGGTTATGRPANSTTATTNGLENKPPAEVLRAAVAALGTAQSVHIVGSLAGQGPFDGRLGRTSATGWTRLTPTEHVWTRVVGCYGYKRLDFGRYAGRWLRYSAQVFKRDTLAEYARYNPLTDNATLRHHGALEPTVQQATVNGKKVVVISWLDGSKLQVANTGPAYPLRVDFKGNLPSGWCTASTTSRFTSPHQLTPSSPPRVASRRLQTTRQTRRTGLIWAAPLG